MATATVTQASPLLIKTDGSDTAVPAVAISGLSLSLNDRVQCDIRTPTKPLVTAKTA